MANVFTIIRTFENPDGVVRTYEERWVREEPEGGKAAYRELRVRNGKEEFSSFGYSGFADDAAFTAMRAESMLKQNADAYASREAERARQQLKAQFNNELKRPIEAALEGLQSREDIVAMLQQGVMWHALLEPLSALLAGPKRTTRQVLRDAYRTARENVREEYPDEYRENGADDFYEDHFDDVAEAMSQEF